MHSHFLKILKEGERGTLVPSSVEFVIDLQKKSQLLNEKPVVSCEIR